MRSCKTNGKEQREDVNIFLHRKGHHLFFLLFFSPVAALKVFPPVSFCELRQGFSTRLAHKTIKMFSSSVFLNWVCSSACCFQETAGPLLAHLAFMYFQSICQKLKWRDFKLRSVLSQCTCLTTSSALKGAFRHQNHTYVVSSLTSQLLLRMCYVCLCCVFRLSVCVCGSRSTLLPLYLSTPERNQCSGGVGEVITGQRVQGQAAAHLWGVLSPHHFLLCRGQVWFSASMHVAGRWAFVVLVHCVHLGWSGGSVIRLFVLGLVFH